MFLEEVGLNQAMLILRFLDDIFLSLFSLKVCTTEILSHTQIDLRYFDSV